MGEGIGVLLPNQETTGTHVNISGIGLTKYSKNPDNATKLIEYMTDVEAQEFLSANNYEFAVNPEAKKPEICNHGVTLKCKSLFRYF